MAEQKNVDNKERLIKDAQYRKGLSIAFFNATNSAITLVVARQIADKDEALKEVLRLRDIFIEEHNNYYAQTIAKIGLNFDVKKTIKKLEMVKSFEELKNAWLFLSEDERMDAEVIKVKDELKKKYEKE